jgi:hypothetical protein
MFKDKLAGTIEADETYIGGKSRGRGRVRHHHSFLGLACFPA